jgi:hypothetical protein
MRTKRIPRAWHVLSALVLALLLAVPALSAFAQDAGANISIDRPTDGDQFRNGDTVSFEGWAAHRAGPGTGIDRVAILDAPVGAGGKVVVEAQYGIERADVAAQYGDAWRNVGYRATWRASGAAGNRTFWVYAHSPSNDGWTNKTVTIRITDSGPAGGAPPPGGQMGQGMYGPGGGYGQGQGMYGPGSPYGAVPYGPYGLGGGYGYGGYPPYGGQPYCPGMYNPYGSGYPLGNPYGGGVYGGYCPPYPPGIPPYSPGYGTGGPLVTVTADPAGTVVLNWLPVPNATQYRIYELVPSSVSTFNLVTSQPQTIGGVSVTATISGLPPGSVHTYQVRAVDSAGVETVVPASSTVQAGVLPPAAVQVTTRTNTSVTLTWTPSPSPGVTQYRVEQSATGTGFVPSVIASGSVTGATVTGLTPNTSYSFQVRAVTSGGVASPPSPPASSTTLP